MDRASAAAQLWQRVVALVDGLSPADWARPTPCAGWDVHDLVGHLAGMQVAFDAGRRVPPPPGWQPDPALSPLDAAVEAGVAARRPWAAAAVRAEAEEARAGHLQRLRAVQDWTAPAGGPLGETTEDGLFQVRMFDIWVHLQDLRSALELPIESDDVSPAAAVAHRYVLDRVPWMWAKRVGAREGATLRLVLGPPLDVDTVVVLRDGRARLDPDAGPGGGSVTGSPAALTLLAAGRSAPEELRALGLLRWSGAGGEDLVSRARLFRAA